METTILNEAVVPSEGTRTINVFGHQVDLLLASAQTEGAFSTYRVTMQPGGSIPPHVHSLDDEAFYVLEGEFEVSCNDAVYAVKAGGYAFLPRGRSHAVRNTGTATGKILGICTPGGHEEFLEDASRIGSSGPPSPEEALAVCRKHGIELLAPPAAP